MGLIEGMESRVRDRLWKKIMYWSVEVGVVWEKEQRCLIGTSGCLP